MIGQVIESRRGLPWGAFLLLATGFALAGWGATEHDTNWIVGAILPVAVGLTLLLLGRPRPFAARLTEEAIELGSARHFADDPAMTVIPYGSLHAVRAEGRSTDPRGCKRRACPLLVEHDGGSFWIPARLNVPSHELFRFLADQLPRDGSRAVNPTLAPYLQRQEDQHGPEAVRSYRAAGTLPRSPARWGWRALFLGIMLAGAIWVGLDLAGWAESGWLGIGIGCLIWGGIFTLITLAHIPLTGRMVPQWKKAGLVLAPDGLAMVQGPVQGEIHWDELQSIRYVPKLKAFRTTQTATLPGIHLKVQGATITIADIYERPLYLIFDEIHAVAPDHLIDRATVPGNRDADVEPL